MGQTLFRIKMKAFVALGFLATAYAGVIPAAPVIPAAAPAIVAAAPAIIDGPVPVSTSKVVAAPALPSTQQFHSQDELGNLAFGYANINYVADGLGFRVAASNLPVAPLPIPAPEVPLPVAPVFTLVGPDPVTETPEVAEKRAEHEALKAEAAAAAAEAPEEE